MQQVITQKQAKQITGGRTPLSVEAYDRACTALQECIDVVDTMKWANLADAYATVAKIQKDEKALRLAKTLKVKAYRRMGELAAELRPQSYGKKGKAPGPQSLLREVGLSTSEARAARILALRSEKSVESVMRRSANVPSPISVAHQLGGSGSSDAWISLTRAGSNLTAFRSFCRAKSARELATGLNADEIEKSRLLAREIADWLDEFEQHLPKSK